MLALCRAAKGQKLAGAQNDTIAIPRTDGAGDIRTRIYKPLGATGPLPIVLFFHGGGYAHGAPEIAHPRFAQLMSSAPCIIVAPAYRVSLEAPYPAGHDDCFDAYCWVQENAQSLGGDPSRIVVFGESAGGGLAISTTLRARDAGLRLPHLVVPLYPMLDDRLENETPLPPKQTLWTSKANQLAWSWLLSGEQGQDTVPPLAAPARVSDVSGMPPMLTFVGDRDIFHYETVQFCNRVKQAAGEVDCKVINGMWHGQDVLAPKSTAAREANDWLLERFSLKVRAPS